MSRFHITEDGPKPCNARKRNCPIGGEHYSDNETAQAAFEKSHNTFPRLEKSLNLDIAKKILNINTLDVRGSDSLDVHEVSRDSVKAALIEALGKSGQTLSEEESRGIEFIAREVLSMESLEASNTSKDFQEVSVSQVNEALTEARELRISRLPRVRTVTGMRDMAKGRYIGSDVDTYSLKEYLDAFEREVGSEEFEKMVKAKAARDRGYKHHLTVVGPPEMKLLKDSDEGLLKEFTIKYEGLGKAVDGDNEAWFVVCSSPQVNDWRSRHGLPPKDLHITLGFRGKDVHNKSKSFDSIIVK